MDHNPHMEVPVNPRIGIPSPKGSKTPGDKKGKNEIQDDLKGFVFVILALIVIHLITFDG
jgi:hypothetical protein